MGSENIANMTGVSFNAHSEFPSQYAHPHSLEVEQAECISMCMYVCYAKQFVIELTIQMRLCYVYMHQYKNETWKFAVIEVVVHV